MASQTKSTVVSTVLENFAMLDKANNVSKYVNSSKFQSILKLWARKAVPCWKHKRRNKGTAMVSQVPEQVTVADRGLPKPNHSAFHSPFFTKRKVQDTGIWPYQATVFKGNSSTTVPSLPHTQGFQPLKMYKQALLRHPHSKAFGILSHSITEWPKKMPAGKPSQAGFQHQAFTALGSRPTRALMLEECHST